jgi:hypothetical protein
VSRLPWFNELPRLWTATMRPKPVMIPVNIEYFRREMTTIAQRMREGPKSIGEEG